MHKSGPIVVIEDDLDDQEVFTSVFNELNYANEIIFFIDGDEVLKFLNATKVKPFLIISDINLPKLNGLELRDKIQNNAALNLKCIPYLFFTSSKSQDTVMHAYSKSIQGFFIKPNSYDELRRILRNIVQYWLDCEAPILISNN